MPDNAVAAFAAALGDDATTYGCPLLGGDTVSTPGPLMVSIAAIGTVPEGRMVPRDGARDGDQLYVTGSIGDAALGLLVARGDPRVLSLSVDHRAFLLERYRRPQPRNTLALVLRENATAAMDVSDGFAGDLTKMLALAGCSTAVSTDVIPLSDAARAAVAAEPGLWATVLTGGDDYEVVCAVPAAKAASFEDEARRSGIAVGMVGTVVAHAGPVIFTEKGGQAIRLDHLSYSHR